MEWTRTSRVSDLIVDDPRRHHPLKQTFLVTNLYKSVIFSSLLRMLLGNPWINLTD